MGKRAIGAFALLLAADATALRGRLDCHGVPGSQDPAKTIDVTGTFEAQP